MATLRLGTCGYSYPWNEGKPTPFQWYLGLGFNTVEINASFYRFPRSSWVRAWLRAPEDFRFSIKVHRSITHDARLARDAREEFAAFRDSLELLRDRISFFLFQMPPSFTYSKKRSETTEAFLRDADLGPRAAVEFRHPTWWEHLDAVAGTGATLCSVDAPDLPRDLLAASDVLYLRIHGRTTWYHYVYPDEELEEIAESVLAAEVRRKYVYMNNDEGMLPNGQWLQRRFGLSPPSQQQLE